MPKWYVVWAGREPGVYDTWAEAKTQIDGYAGAKYRAFPTQRQALEAYEDGYDAYVRAQRESGTEGLPGVGYLRESFCVDAACSGNPGALEYRGLYTASRGIVFHKKGLFGTNNIGEFLAIVHILALQERHGTSLPVYSDSLTAITWVRRKKCGTKLAPSPQTQEILSLVARAEKWLREHPIRVPLYKWNTGEWGEIPADFGRK